MAKESTCDHALCDDGLKLALFFLLILLVGGALVFLVNPRPMNVEIESQTAPMEDTIYAQGTAQRDVSPDLLELSLGAESEGETAAESQSANAAAINAVKASLMANGVAESDIRTSYYNVYPMTQSRRVCPEYAPMCDDSEKEWVSEIIGYKTTHLLRVRSTGLDSAGTLVDSAVRAGSNRVDSISFTLKDETRKGVEDGLIAEAMADARARAGRIASGLGVSLGKVSSASVGGYYAPVVTRDYYMAEAAAPGGTSFSPGELTVSISSSVTFEIEQ